MNSGRELVHLFWGDPFLFWHTQVFENLGAATVLRLVRHSGHDVKVDVGVLLGLRELNHIGLGASGDELEGNGHATDQCSQFDRFLLGEFVDRRDVSSYDED